MENFDDFDDFDEKKDYVNDNDYTNYENNEKVVEGLNKAVDQSIYKKYRYIQRSNYNYSIAATLMDFIDGKDIPLYKIARLASIIDEMKENSSNIVSQGKGITLFYYVGEKIVLEIEDVISPANSRIDKLIIKPEKAKWEAYNTNPSNIINLKIDKKYDKKRMTYIAKYLGATLNYINNNILDDSKILSKNIK